MEAYVQIYTYVSIHSTSRLFHLNTACYLFITNCPKILQLKITNIYYLILIVDQEFGSSFTRQFVLRVFHEVAVRILAKAPVI